jgi:hypothetical protein
MAEAQAEGMMCLPLIDIYSILLDTYLTLFNIYSMLINPYSKLFDAYSTLFDTHSMLLDITVPTKSIKMSQVTTPPVHMKFHPGHRSLT